MDNGLIYNRIKDISKNKKIPLKYIASVLGQTEAGFHRSLKKQSLKVNNLIKICEILDISPVELFEEEKEKHEKKLTEESKILKEIYLKLKEHYEP